MAPSAHRSIFVSYTLRDGALDLAWLSELASEIRRFARPYVDALHNDSADHQARVIDELLSASVLLACPSPGYLASPWVRLELSIAHRSGVPVVYLPASLDLAECTRVLRRLEAASGPHGGPSSLAAVGGGPPPATPRSGESEVASAGTGDAP